MFTRRPTKIFDLIKIHHQEIRITRERKWIERRIFTHTGKVAQPQRSQLILPPFITGG